MRHVNGVRETSFNELIISERRTLPLDLSPRLHRDNVTTRAELQLRALHIILT